MQTPTNRASIRAGAAGSIGEYSFAVRHLLRPGTYAAVFAGLASISPLAVAAPLMSATQQAGGGDKGDQAQAPSDIIVTGTRRLARTVVQSLSPIDVVDPNALNLTPADDLNDRLAQTIPSFSVQRLLGVDGAVFRDRHRFAISAPTKSWCWSTGIADIVQPSSTSRIRAPNRSISRRFRCPRSVGSRCCETERPRNMVQTPSPA